MKDRPIQLIAVGKWIVVDDRYDLATTPWAEQLSKALGAVAVRLRVLEDEYGLQRFDKGKLVGTIDNLAATKKALARRIAGKIDTVAATRALEQKVMVPTAFLSDLAQGATRAKLTKGLRFAPSEGGAAIVDIAKLAKLPEPLSPSYGPQPDLQLCFRRDARPGAARTVAHGARGTGRRKAAPK